MTPEVMTLPPDGWSTIAPGMARAFQDDPMFVAGFPDSHQRLDAVEAFMRWLYRVSLLGGAVVECTRDLDAVAVWEPPGLKYSLLTHVRAGPEALAWIRLAGLGDLRRFLGLSARWDRRRRELVPEPHWRLAILGVAPYRQKSGLGALLARHGIARANAMGAPVFAETVRPATAHLCERLGFDVLEQTTDDELHIPVWRLLHRPSARPKTGDTPADVRGVHEQKR
jgi:hypothetical protein